MRIGYCTCFHTLYDEKKSYVAILFPKEQSNYEYLPVLIFRLVIMFNCIFIIVHKNLSIIVSEFDSHWMLHTFSLVPNKVNGFCLFCSYFIVDIFLTRRKKKNNFEFNVILLSLFLKKDLITKDLKFQKHLIHFWNLHLILSTSKSQIFGAEYYFTIHISLIS